MLLKCRRSGHRRARTINSRTIIIIFVGINANWQPRCLCKTSYASSYRKLSIMQFGRLWVRVKAKVMGIVNPNHNHNYHPDLNDNLTTKLTPMLPCYPFLCLTLTPSLPYHNENDEDIYVSSDCYTFQLLDVLFKIV